MRADMGSSEIFYCGKYPSPAGELLMAADSRGIRGLWFTGQKYYAAGLPEDVICDEGFPLLREGFGWLDRYFAGERPSPRELKLAPAGTPFRLAVWQRLLDIPYGETVSYGELARDIAAAAGYSAMSARAVGGAVGHNPISVIIPCHRVVGADGSLTGYAGGTEIKRFLLEHEKRTKGR